MDRINRRKALAIGAIGCAHLLSGCWETDATAELSTSPVTPDNPSSGATVASSSPPPSAPISTAATAWTVGPLYFTVGALATFDLTATLPRGVIRGGSFGVSENGATLPSGMTLSSAGILSIGSATSSLVASVVFTYTEPSV